MKQKLIIVGTIFLVGVAAYFLGKEDLIIKNVPPKNGKIIIFGDSLAEGVGATTGNDLSSRLEKRLGKTTLNFGRSGDTTRDALERLSETSKEDPGLVVVILGGNDVIKKIPQAETFNNLEKIVAFFQSRGAAVVLVGVRSGLIGDGRGDDFKVVAEKTGALYVSDILQDVFANPQYMSDMIHPNDSGYAMIEERLAPIIADLFQPVE